MKLPWINKLFTHSLTPPIRKHDQIKMRDYTNGQKAGYLTSMTKPLD